jgi:hypothetical protein
MTSPETQLPQFEFIVSALESGLEDEQEEGDARRKRIAAVTHSHWVCDSNRDNIAENF